MNSLSLFHQIYWYHILQLFWDQSHCILNHFHNNKLLCFSTFSHIVSAERSTTTVCSLQFTTFSPLLTLMRSNSCCPFVTLAINDLPNSVGCRNLTETEHFAPTLRHNGMFFLSILCTKHMSDLSFKIHKL